MPNNNPFVTGNNNPMPMPGGVTTAATQDDFEVDLSNVSSGFLIPEGNYLVQCTDVEQGVSKAGNPQFIWTFNVVGGEHAGFEFKVFTAITPAAMWKVAETVEALGVGQTGSVVKFKRTDVIGKQCGAIVETNEYNNNKRSQISKVISLAELKERNS